MINTSHSISKATEVAINIMVTSFWMKVILVIYLIYYSIFEYQYVLGMVFFFRSSRFTLRSCHVRCLKTRFVFFLAWVVFADITHVRECSQFKNISIDRIGTIVIDEQN